MKKSIVNRWVKALRSGDYEQAKGELKDEHGRMCCLAVLCDITKKETGGEWTNTGSFKKGNLRLNNGLLPLYVQEILGISENGLLKRQYKDPNGTNCNDLVDLNDSGLSFKQIANIIEKNF